MKFNREFILPEDQENGSTGKEIRIFKNKTVKAKDDRQHRRNADFKHWETRHIESNKTATVGLGEDISRTIL